MAIASHRFSSAWLFSAVSTLSRAHLSSGVRATMERWVGHLSGRSVLRAAMPPIGQVSMGDLRRLTPVSRTWGFERGGAIDRYYIERFLSAHQGDIGGHVLEIGDDRYTRRFGGSRVFHSDVVDVTRANHRATIVADLSAVNEIPSDHFDCIILTQMLHVIEEPRRVVETLFRILKPYGVVLATLPGISQVRAQDWGGYWCGGYRSARSTFATVFSPEAVEVQTYGNVLAAVAFLEGLGAVELRRAELDYHDPDYEVTIGIRAIKHPR